EAMHAAIGGDYAAIPESPPRERGGIGGLLVLFVVFALMMLFAGRRGGRRGGRRLGGRGFWPWLLPPMVGGGGRGFGGGIGGGGRGFGGGGFGGFGGGGGFSGGGASGGW